MDSNNDYIEESHFHVDLRTKQAIAEELPRLKTSELRIGNIVGYGPDRKPTRIRGRHLKDGVENYSFTALRLTTQWLIKLGFEYYTDRHVYRLSGVEIEIDVTGETDVEKRQIIIREVSHQIILKTVHQFQNVFFGLTGKELILKRRLK